MSNMGGSYRRSFFGFSAFALVLLALSAGPVYAQLDYGTPATTPTPAVQQPAQPATQTPAAFPPAQPTPSAPLQQAGLDETRVRQIASDEISKNKPTSAASAIGAILFLVLCGVVVWLVVIRNRKTGGGLSKADVQKITSDMERAFKDVIGKLPKVPTMAEIVEAVMKALPPAPKTLTEAEVIAIVKKLLPTPPPPVQPPVSEVKVRVNPAQIDLEPGKTVKFSAEVTGTENKSVTWLISPETLGQFVDGSYTAPTTFHHPVTLFVKCVSVADPTKAFTTKVILVPAKNGGEKPPIPPAEPAAPKPAGDNTKRVARPNQAGIGRIGFVALLAILLMFVHFAFGAVRCYNPATAPKGSTPSVNNAIPLSVTAVPTSMSCPGQTGTVEVAYLSGSAIPVTGNASAFTFTPPTHGRATIRVNGQFQSTLVIEDGPDAIRINGAVDLARESISGAATGGSSDERMFRSLVRGMAQNCGFNEQQFIGLLNSRQAGTSKQAAALMTNCGRQGLLNAVFTDPRFVAVQARATAAQQQADAAKAKADEAEALAQSKTVSAPAGTVPAPAVTDDHIRIIAHTEAVAVVAPVKKTADEANNIAGYTYDKYGQLVRVVAGMNGVKDPAAEKSKTARQKTLGSMLKDLHCADPNISDGDRKKFGCPAQ